MAHAENNTIPIIAQRRATFDRNSKYPRGMSLAHGSNLIAIGQLHIR
jgi:hypothetical protein